MALSFNGGAKSNVVKQVNSASVPHAIQLIQQIRNIDGEACEDVQNGQSLCGSETRVAIMNHAVGSKVLSCNLVNTALAIRSVAKHRK